MHVVRFDDIDVPARQRRRGALHQFGQDGHAQAEIARPDQGDAGRRRGQCVLLRRIDARGAGHQRTPTVHAQGQNGIEAFGQAEVDGRVEGRNAAQLGGGEMRHAIDDTLRGGTACHGGDHRACGLLGGQAEQSLAHPA